MTKRILMLILAIMMIFSLCVNAEEVATIEETAVAETTRENLALNKDVYATDEEDEKGNIAINLTDGNEVSYWASDIEGSSAEVDLGGIYFLDTVEFIPHGGRNYGYKISVSIDGINYVSVAEDSNTEKATVVTEEFAAVEARYVMLTITKIPYDDTEWINIKEIRVYGETPGMPLYYGDEGQGLSIEVNGTEITGTFSGESRTAWSRKMTLIVAVFDGNKMIAYNAETKKIPEYGTEVSETISLTIVDSSVELEGKRVELFVWDDLENMQTLVAPMGITIETTE